MKNDRGFTLIELIVVMLIMAVMGVGAVSGFHLLNSGNSNRIAKRIVTTLDYVQSENMTKSQPYTMQIKKNATTGDFELKVFKDTTEESSEVLEVKSGEIAFLNNRDDTEHILNSSEPSLKVSFRKDTGGVKEYATDGLGSLYVTRIKITSSGRSSFIRLVTATGKHFIE